MARTKASVGAKVSSGKSNKAKCSAAMPASAPSSSGSERSKGGGGGGGNPVCPRDTPKWQRAITNFFVRNESAAGSRPAVQDMQAAGSSKPRKRNVIDSDDEEDPPKNTELDESIYLEPLTGDASHKIEEYYPKNGKGKGVGKKTGKENDQNDRNKKREREEDAEESGSKRVKVSCE